MTHPSPEELVSYLAGDSDNEEITEAHLFECGHCATAAAQLAPVAAALRQQIPMVLNRAWQSKLRARGLRLRDNPVTPGERSSVSFPSSVDILLHRLGGLRLEAATRVEVTIRVESTGQVLAHLPEASFDRNSNEVVVACQQHFSVFPPDTEMEIRVHAPDGGQLERYSVLHHFGA